MSTIAAIQNTHPAAVSVAAAPTKVVSMFLSGPSPANGVSGLWAIFGKVVIANSNAKAQNATAELLFGKTALDTTTVFLPGNGISQSLSMEGLATGPGCVEISCNIAAGPGTAQFAHLVAISVDLIENAQSC